MSWYSIFYWITVADGVKEIKITDAVHDTLEGKTREELIEMIRGK